MLFNSFTSCQFLLSKNWQDVNELKSIIAKKNVMWLLFGSDEAVADAGLGEQVARVGGICF